MENEMTRFQVDMDARIRVTSISISGFKGVSAGSLSFDNSHKSYDASILALYGQNGSGKTAMINAFELLQNLLSGQELDPAFADLINTDSEYADLEYRFTIENQSRGYKYDAVYEVRLGKELVKEPLRVKQTKGTQHLFRPLILGEILSCSYRDEVTRNIMAPVINTFDGEVFGPKAKYAKLIGGGKDKKIDLLVAKKSSQKESRSFVFSDELYEAVSQKNSDGKYTALLVSLSWFGAAKLFVVGTILNYLITSNAMVFNFQIHDNEGGSSGAFLVRIDDDVCKVPVAHKELSSRVFEDINVVLKQIVPGLTIEERVVGETVMPDGSDGYNVQYLSKRNGKEIPLRCESDGVKKIISILHLLIAVYNDPSVTVVIDELDSGVFEYLLGELLRVISERGKGQLIFTSHNLRPLETLDKGFVAFTTANPENRYIRLTNVKANNNLRDFYYRDIILGEQSEPLYERTSNNEIALALKMAGARHGA